MAEKTYVFDGGGNNGFDANLLAAMNGGGFGGGMWNNPLYALIFLAAFQNGGFGNGGNNAQLSQIQDTLNTNQGNTLLMDAIKGGTSEIQSLANALNCDINSVKSAIDATRSVIQSGNQSLSSQLAQCCCDNKMMSMQQGYENRIANLEQSYQMGERFTGIANGLQKGFSDLGYILAQNKGEIILNQDRNTQRLVDVLNNHWNSELQQKYNDVRLEMSQYRQNEILLNAIRG